MGICLIWLYFETMKAYFNYKLKWYLIKFYVLFSFITLYMTENMSLNNSN